MADTSLVNLDANSVALEEAVLQTIKMTVW